MNALLVGEEDISLETVQQEVVDTCEEATGIEIARVVVALVATNTDIWQETVLVSDAETVVDTADRGQGHPVEIEETGVGIDQGIEAETDREIEAEIDQGIEVEKGRERRAERGRRKEAEIDPETEVEKDQRRKAGKDQRRGPVLHHAVAQAQNAVVAIPLVKAQHVTKNKRVPKTMVAIDPP
eukprot:TRINITY_DN1475_c0_g2_i2.p3 TRINITY_DN1475_c0_g2~~TRINITY_DN1475_c0_g2_i2.p3  ORF type:complete len:183 (-),score=28.98 TRINITY_DN1475_c0_g2_i2:349-897(-)